ncbi:MAG: replicative DNA helicase [Bacteroidales bacterium]|nr:replicative DNA helicase [Bacteroidales bacterium]
MAEDGDRKRGAAGRKSAGVNLESLGLEMGNKPPQALDVEEAVLGALLVEPGCIDEVMEDLTEKTCFYDERNQLIYEAMRALYNDHAPVDIVTVNEQLRRNNNLETVGGAVRLAELSSKISAAANIEFYTKILKQKWIQRRLITASYSILKTAYDEGANVEDLIDNAQSRIFEAVESSNTKEAQVMKDIINKAIGDLEKAQERKGGLSGVPSGYPSLDAITLGWQASDLIILAARPSVGKTAFALNVARNAAVDHNIPVAVFSLEMPAIQLAKRMMVSETGLDSKKIKGGTPLESEDWKRLEEQLRRLSQAPLYIDDTPSLPVMEFRSKVKRLVKEKKVQLIVVDYLQLMQGPAELRAFREQEVAAISRTLKATAKEHGVPIIALSQLSRNAVQRQGSNTRPQLSDLRESGSLAQDADMVLSSRRSDYQGLGGEDAVKGETKLIIAKHRNGEIGDVDLIFHDNLARFDDAATAGFLPADANADFGEPQEYESRMNSMNDDFAGGYGGDFS